MKKLVIFAMCVSFAFSAPYDVVSQVANRMDLILLRLSSPSCERMNTIIVDRNSGVELARRNTVKTDSFAIDSSQGIVKLMAESAISRLRYEWSSPWREEFNGISRSFSVVAEPKSSFLMLIAEKPERNSDVCIMSITRP